MTQTETMGKRIAAFRKKRGLTQDQLAEQLGISAQAVSKWETDLSCPDIGIIPQLAEILEVSLDDLFGVEKKGPAAVLVPEEQRKSADQLIFRIIVDSGDGDKVRVNLPLILLRALDGSGASSFQMNGQNLLEGIDIGELIRIAEAGMLGELIEVDSADGDHVLIFVE